MNSLIRSAIISTFRPAAAAGAATDTNFANTVLLLHGDGTNGAQNQTFLDSGTANTGGTGFTITRNGNTTQGTFSPFSQTGWSNYFDGTGDYLQIAANSAFNCTGDFTLEFWINPFNNSGSSGYQLYIGGNAGSSYFGLKNNQYVAQFSGGGEMFWTGQPSLNVWTHLALVRSGSTVTLYVNGTSAGTNTSSAAFLDATNAVQIGAYVADFNTKGYLSNLRLVKGTAVYTANFTVPTTALTAITNTSLLTCNSNRFKDDSTNNFTITRNGDTSVQAFSPFAPTAAYSAATNGGSGYFDGTGDNLTATSADTANAMGTGNWTAEAWIYLTTGGGTPFVFDTLPSGSGSATGLRMRLNSSNQLQLWQYGSAVLTSTAAVTVNAWTHVALVKNSGTTTAYVNGTASGTYSDSGNYICGTNRPMIGSDGFNNGSENSFPGYISNLRLVKGTAVYTTGFTPPTAPLTAITNTSLLLNFTNAAIIDSTAKNVLETVGNAQANTIIKKFGTASMSFDGTGDYLFTPSKAITSLEGNFTVEMWIYRIAGNNFFFTLGDSSLSTGFDIYIGTAGTVLNFFSNNAARITATPFAATTWSHLAVARSGSTITMYVDGVSVGTWTSSATFSGAVYVGAEFYGGSVTGTCNGFIDDLRITKGVARYTANFTPPTAAFSDQ